MMAQRAQRDWAVGQGIRCAAWLCAALASTAWGQDPNQPISLPPVAEPAQQEAPPAGLLDLEQLAEIEVETASIAGRREQSIDQTPAAVSKLDGVEIRRLGTDSIADALRAIPGMYVARESRGRYAINGRGPPSLFSNQLLVMRDGRPIYTPIFAGTQWEKEDYLLSDLDAIEVIRGPGSTIWGSNAVNGIVNILTKSSFETLGWQLQSSAGSHERLMSQVRYGTLLEEDTALRVFGKWFDRDGFRAVGTSSEYGDHTLGMSGFRLDTRLDQDEDLMLSGEIFEGRVQSLSRDARGSGAELVRDVVVHRGGHLLGRWLRRFEGDEQLEVNGYLEWNDQGGDSTGEARRTAEFDLTHSFDLSERWSVTWGTGARYVLMSLKNYERGRFRIGDEAYYLVSAFGQASYDILPEELTLTFGTKLEVNARSGFEIQPSTRVAWMPTETHTLWSAISRSVRTPGLTDLEIDIPVAIAPPAAPGLGPSLIEYSGNPDFDSESSVSLELGWRWRPASCFTLDVAGHTTFYRDYRTYRFLTPFIEPGLPPFLVQPIGIDNGSEAEIFGIEVEAQWKPYENWMLSTHWAASRYDVHDANPAVGSAERTEGALPGHVVHLRSFLDITEDIGWNVSAWYVSATPGFSSGPLTRLDTNLSWSPIEGVTWTLGGRNLLESDHQEATGEALKLAERTEREFWLALDWRF